MSSVSEQDHLNPRDPLYYAPRWLRDRSSAARDAAPGTPFSPASFDSRLENAVSDALRHPLDPQVMGEPEMEPKKELWRVAARFGAAVGVSAVAAMFFVIIVPGPRPGDNEPSVFSTLVQSVKSALVQARDDSRKPAISEFQAVLSAAPANAAASEPSGQLLKQFMQWKPDTTTAQRANQ
ncbi:MAG: hypothetical protein PS018_23370 [bacterium]|nr:hypothetical protein [bacterium]